MSAYQNVPTISTGDEEAQLTALEEEEEAAAEEIAEVFEGEEEHPGVSFLKNVGKSLSAASLQVRDKTLSATQKMGTSISDATQQVGTAVQSVFKKPGPVDEESADKEDDEDPEDRLGTMMRRASSATIAARDSMMRRASSASIAAREGIARRASEASIAARETMARTVSTASIVTRETVIPFVSKASVDAKDGVQRSVRDLSFAVKAIGTSPMQKEIGASEVAKVKGEGTDKWIHVIYPQVTLFICVVVFIIGILAMVSTSNAVVDLSCYCLYVSSIIVSIQKLKLHRLGEMREQQNRLRANCDELAVQNNALSQSVNELQLQLTK